MNSLVFISQFMEILIILSIRFFSRLSHEMGHVVWCTCMLCNRNRMIIYTGMCFSVDEYNYTSETALKCSHRKSSDSDSWEKKGKENCSSAQFFCEILNRIETTLDCWCLFQFLFSLLLLQNYTTVITKKKKTFILAFLTNPQIHQQSKWKLINKLFSFGLSFSME